MVDRCNGEAQRNTPSQESPMSEPIFTPQVLMERYFGAVRSGMDLAGRRAEAACEFWAAVPHVREASDLVALQSGFWRRAIEDYHGATQQALQAKPAAAPKASAAQAA